MKNARQDVERLRREATTLRDVLDRMAETSDKKIRKHLNLSNDVLKSLDQCSQDLRNLQKKLQPKPGHKTMSRVGLRALKWLFSKSAVNDEVRWIENYLAIFNAAVQLGHMYVSNRMAWLGRVWLRHDF